MKFQITNILTCLIFSLVSININAQDISEKQKENIQSKINFNISFAQTNIDNNEFYKAQKDLDDALQLAKQINDNRSIGLIYSKIGKIQYIIEEPMEAMQSLSKAVEKQRFAQDDINIAETYKTIGNIYLSRKEYEKAIDYFNSAEQIFEKHDLSEFEAESKLYIGQALFNLGNYTEAKTQFEDAKDLAKRYKNKKILSSAYLSLGETEAKLQDFANSEIDINEGFEIAKLENFPNLINKAYKILSDIHTNRGDYKKANTYLLKHIKLNDSILKIKRSYLSADKRLDKQYSSPIEYQKEKEADLEKEASSTWLEKLTTILSIALITILSLLTLSLYKNNNIRLKSNNILHKKNAELTIAMEKAELATKTKANFLSTVTHELRTPLYAVTGLTNMLLEENPKQAQIQHLKSLKFSGDYLLTFINDILQINKIEANKVDIEPEVFNLKKKAENVISALNNSALDNNIKLHLEYDETLPTNFNADQLKISQILINLIGNSIKFTKNGDIWIRIIKHQQDGDDYVVRYEVEDNGIGISQEKQKNMFESFSQGSIQINRKYGGTGLGLSIVKGLIDILKGKIYMKSELGTGTTFYFEIPMKKSNEIIVEQKANYFNEIDEIELNNIKILVVEDNKINQMITKKILNKMKLYCDVVDNGEDAVDKVKNTKYDVVLMDIHMPGISGMEATKIIRTFDTDLTIFALTAVTIEDKMQEFDDAGFTDIISKPFKQEDFEKKLYNALNLSDSTAT
ncbi:response regulator [Olleya aquimaris]|uniref:histidine kinase n=1 Tax=Olleya sediminilitoris TaxID=2795739 RepID=A0ABS1WJI6_9FLAO|nr:ATP-binding protein [Olleya sediminilitoris]AXO81354.1 response regulator [Olleya aquimaris]MBL7559282.1 response regulator [Olleya sediminilitoris]